MSRKDGCRKRRRAQIASSAKVAMLSVENSCRGKMGGSANAKPAMRVPWSKRISAYALDWAIGGVATGAPAVLLYSAVTRRTDFYSNLYVFEALGYPAWLGILAGVLCVCAGLFYYVYVPTCLMPGQTVGKRLMGVEVRTMEGGIPSLKAFALRYGMVGFLLENSAFVAGRFVRELATLVTRFDLATPWAIFGLLLTIISMYLALCRSPQRAIHDYVAGTHVVMCGSRAV